MLVSCKGNTGCTNRWTGLFKLLGIINKTCKISLLFELTDFKNTVVKFYLIKPKDDNPNNALKTKYDDSKNGYEENYLPTVGPITINFIFAVMVIPLVAVDLQINLSLNDHNYEVVSPLLVRKNSD